MQPSTPPGAALPQLARVLGECGAITVVVAVLLWQRDHLDHLFPLWPTQDIGTLLTLGAAGVATAAGIATRLGPRQAKTDISRQLTGPLAFYGVVLIPASVLHLPAGMLPGVSIAHVAASSFFLALVGLALVPTRADQLTWPLAVASGVFLTITAGAAGQIFLDAEQGPAVSTFATRVVLVGWWVVATLFVVVGGLRGQIVTWRVGLGLSMVAVAHLEWLSPTPDEVPSLTFGVLRLLGLLVVLLGLSRPAVLAISADRQHQQVQRERLAAAEHVTRQIAIDVAECDHEIRNVLSGLSGVIHLLRADVPDLAWGDRTRLGSALHAELNRLRHLLGHDAADSGAVLVSALLTRLTTLWRVQGASLKLDLEPGLRTSMPAAELTQVLTNLLINCARHAPGAPVRIRTIGSGDMVWIEVADDGPGLEPKTIIQDQQDAPAHGSGIGLKVCARLLEAHGGALHIRSTSEDGRGFTAGLHLPRAVRDDEAESVSGRRPARYAAVAAQSSPGRHRPAPGSALRPVR